MAKKKVHTQMATNDSDTLPGLPFDRERMMELLEKGRQRSLEALEKVEAMRILDDQTLRRPLR